MSRIALIVVLLAGCVPRPQPAPTPPPAPAPVQPTVAEPPQPEPPPAAWDVAPLSPGDWRLDGFGARAAFGAGSPLFAIECVAGGQIRLVRPGAGGGAALTIVTSYGARALNARAEAGATAALVASADPLLDEMAFSRGRFLVRVEGLPDLVLPSWPEPARVIEECRS